MRHFHVQVVDDHFLVLARDRREAKRKAIGASGRVQSSWAMALTTAEPLPEVTRVRHGDCSTGCPRIEKVK
jgi:hypothetical protein